MFINQKEIAHLAQDLSSSLDLGLLNGVLERVENLPHETTYFELSKACADKTFSIPTGAYWAAESKSTGCGVKLKLRSRKP